MTPEPDIAAFREMIALENEQIEARRVGAGLLKDTDGKIRHGLVGLALSGGGIRSGTFNLGILQGLSHKKLLPYVDYLSTVSGGGYIGTWLHGVILRQAAGSPAGAKAFLDRPENQPHTEESDPIVFLRKYTSYLAPSLGLFSADFWVIMVIWFRNMFLNQLMLIPSLAALPLLATTLGVFRAWIANSGSFTPAGLLPRDTLAAVLIVLLVMAAAIRAGLGAGENESLDSSPESAKATGKTAGGAAGAFCALVLLAASFLLASASADFAAQHRSATLRYLFVIAVLLLGIVQYFGRYTGCYRARHPGAGRFPALLNFLAWPAIAGAAIAGVFYAVIQWIASWESAQAGSWHVVAWGPPLLMFVWMAGAGLHVGLMGSDLSDYAREWLARVGAFMTIAALGWAAMFALTIFGPWWLATLGLEWGKTVTGLIGAWLAVTAAGVVSGGSPRTSGNPGETESSGALEVVAKISPSVFVVGMILAIALCIHAALASVSGIHCAGCAAPLSQAGNPELKLRVGADRSVHVSAVPQAAPPEWLMSLSRDYWCVLASPGSSSRAACPVKYDAGIRAAELLAAVLLLVLFLESRIDINEFSLHHFYKNRLVRCYLGASQNGNRRPSRLTGFDPTDDFPIRYLMAKPDAAAQSRPRAPYFGPYPIVNGTVNLDRGSDMAKQERKGESFIFTPLYCGFNPPHSPEDKREIDRLPALSAHGFRGTFNYMYPKKGPDIGTCMGISGAAANPNWGYHTSPAIAFLLTVFDVRLGWWVGNPRRQAQSVNPGPPLALHPLISELFSQTSSRAKYLNISDGGHFENLAIYELVNRRCRYIIAGDGEEDGNLTFESLGGVVRKCRVDFGVEISIDPRSIRKHNGFSTTHCVVGKIQYPPDPANPRDDCKGWLLYLKASLTGDEPADVTQYQSVHGKFPQESTANQFFTESQFESYRKLGLHVLNAAFENVEIDWSDPRMLDALFERLWNQWYPPSGPPDGFAARHAEAYSSLLQRLGADPDLAYLDAQFIRPQSGAALLGKALPSDPDIQRKAFFYCLEFIQLMENVWADFHLYNQADRNSPRNQGWISVFQHWAKQDIFINTWAEVARTYNPLFRDFFTLMKEG